MPSEARRQASIPSDYRQAKAVEDAIVAAATAHGYNEEALFAVRLAVEEALANAIRHGNHADARKRVLVRYAVSDRQIDVHVSDEGKGFDPSRVPDPTAAENLQLPSGRGIMLMRAYMTKVEFNGRGNEVHLVKRKLAG